MPIAVLARLAEDLLGSDRPDLANSCKCQSLSSRFEAELGFSEAALPVWMPAPDDPQSGSERCVVQSR